MTAKRNNRKCSETTSRERNYFKLSCLFSERLATNSRLARKCPRIATSMKGCCDGKYLARSALFMRKMFGGCLDFRKGCELDRKVCLVLTKDGPVCMDKKKTDQMDLRRTGDYHYTHDLAASTFKDAIKYITLKFYNNNNPITSYAVYIELAVRCT